MRVRPASQVERGPRESNQLTLDGLRRRIRHDANAQMLLHPPREAGFPRVVEPVTAEVLLAGSGAPRHNPKVQIALQERAERASKGREPRSSALEMGLVASLREILREAHVDGIIALVRQEWKRRWIINKPGVDARFSRSADGCQPRRRTVQPGEDFACIHRVILNERPTSRPTSDMDATVIRPRRHDEPATTLTSPRSATHRVDPHSGDALHTECGSARTRGCR